MEEIQPKPEWKDCCGFCYKGIMGEPFVNAGGAKFCNPLHAAILADYLHLCAEAKAEASKFDDPVSGKKGEIDYKVAHSYLEHRVKLAA